MPTFTVSSSTDVGAKIPLANLIDDDKSVVSKRAI